MLDPNKGKNKHKGRAGVASQPEKTPPKVAGEKLKGFMGVTKKKPEPDTAIVRSSKGVGGPGGAKAGGRAARMERLKNLRI